MNVVSANALLWQIDCHEFRKAGLPFELTDITTPGQEKFCRAFCARYRMRCEKRGSTMRFDPQR